MNFRERGFILKKIIVLLFSTLLLLPIMASAHTSLSSSNPAEGQVVTEDLDQILVHFATPIEELSTMKLVKDGTSIPLKEVKALNKQLTGEISEPLENGTYTILWNIIGEDGHPIQGEINFQVQRALDPNTEQTSDDQVNNEDQVKEDKANTEDNSQTPQKDVVKEEAKTTADAANEEKNSSLSANVLLPIFIGLLMIIGIGLIIFFFKKR